MKILKVDTYGHVSDLAEESVVIGSSRDMQRMLAGMTALHVGTALWYSIEHVPLRRHHDVLLVRPPRRVSPIRYGCITLRFVPTMGTHQG